MRLEKTKKYIEVSVNVFAAAILAFFLSKLIYYHYQLITCPYPLEYREGAMIMTTEALLKGTNPFALENQPAYTNVYGIVYSLVAYPFAKIFGPTTHVHRAVSAFFAIASCLLLGATMHRKKIPLLLNLCGVLMFYALLLYPRTTTPASGPSTLGLFLFLLGIFLPSFFNYSLKSITASIVLAVLAFYTKPYFVLVIPYLTCYIFLFISKKRGMIYGGLSLLLLSASALIMNHFFDVYFHNVILVHTNATFNEISYCLTQFKLFYRIHRQLLNLLFIALAALLLKALISSSRANDGKDYQNRLRNIRSKLRFSGINEPLLAISFKLSLFCLLCSGALLYFRLARNQGAWMWYLFQLLSPFVIIFALEIFKRYKRFCVFLLPFLIINLNTMTRHHNLYDPDEFAINTENWERIEFLVSSNQDILNSPIIAPLLVHQKKTVYDSGLSEYFKMGSYRRSFRWLIPRGTEEMVRHYDYLIEIKQKIREKKFDIAILTKEYSPLVFTELQEHYRYIGMIRLDVPHTCTHFTETVWIPK